jgi:superfamily II DNA/RNA helicase
MKRIPANGEVASKAQLLKKPQNFGGKFPYTALWREVLSVLLPEAQAENLRPVQRLALAKHKILETRQNLIIAAPTSSGKSLLGYLVLIEALLSGKRALWLSPLKALAREKADELKGFLPALEKILKKKLTVHLTTGDFRIEHELFSAPPPGSGESSIVIATPERMEVILRNPQYQKWFLSIGAVCVDEAHLLGDKRRGPVLEYLLTSLFSLSETPPRMILLSASLGDTSLAEKWLAPCRTIRFEQRVPPLIKEVWELSADEEKDEIIFEWLKNEVLTNSSNQALIFVYQTSAAEKLADAVKKKLFTEADPFHARLAESTREKTQKRFIGGKTKVIVATTALALGINLPASHVLVRETVFPGAKSLSPAELLQMMGRAGRGDSPGTSIVLVKAADSDKGNNSSAHDLAKLLSEEKLPELASAFSSKLEGFKNRGDQANENERVIRLAEIIAGLLARNSAYGLTLPEIQTFFARSLGGSEFAEAVPQALAWMQSPERVLAFENKADKKIKLTTLGTVSAVGVLPLRIAAGYGQLIRDLLFIDPSDNILSKWQNLDHLSLLQLFSTRSGGRRFSSKLTSQIDAWMERHPNEVPVLYREWIRGDEKSSRAAEIFGSLGITILTRQIKGKNQKEEISPFRQSYMALLRAILLWERARGVSAGELERVWHIENLCGLEESWRDEMLWLLAATLGLWEVRPFYYHLKEECRANEKRLRLLKQIFRQRQQQIYTLLDQIKYCSPLGATFRRLKSKGSPVKIRGIGIASIRKLEDAGFKSFSDLLPLSEEDLVGLGLRASAARDLKKYFRRRAQ